MNGSNEDYVTRLLSKCEILDKNPDLECYDNENVLPMTPSVYNLGMYLKREKCVSGRFGDKYIFVK